MAILDSLGHLRQGNSCCNYVEDEMVQKLCKQGRLKDALQLVECMVRQTPIKHAAYVSLLRECTKRKLLTEGKRVHALIAQCKCDPNIFLANNLIAMYSKCASPLDARLVFNAMPQRNVVSWTAMIAGYAQNGLGTEAIALYEQMKKDGVEANKITYLCLLKACANIGALQQGKQIHSLIVQKGFHLDTIIQNTLIDMYAKCRCLEDARELFNNMTGRTVVSWTAMIAGYTQNGLGTEAIALYEQMKQDGVQADEVTFACVLKACANVGALEQGKQIHFLIMQKGFHLDIILQSTLVDMYAKCGCIENARELFNNMSERDVVSWNAMIAGYAQNGLGTEAIALYEQMKQEGMEALDITLQNTLIDIYAKCGCLDDARELFNKMSERDVVSWNAMIGGYTQNGHGREAITLYEQMKQESIYADRVTLVCVLKACANIGALQQGKQIHSLIVQKGFHLDTIVQSTLVDMYAKCGCLDDARELFNNMSERDVVSWNVIIAGYAQNGLGTEAIALYEQMKQEAIQPNGVTYICILSACSHSGLVKEGFCVFDFMCKYSGEIPTVEHYACVVDLLGRAGRFAEAKDLIMKMPIQPGPVVWMSLLGAARNAGNVEIGQHAFDYVVKLEPENAAPYLLLMDIYAYVGRMDKVAEMRKEMKDKGLKKIPGCTWIEMDKQVHAFVVGDENHPSSQQIWSELTRLLRVIKKAGHMPDLSSVLEDESDVEKDIALDTHSEMLAIAFGLISKPPFVPIRIKKNLRVYCDCHNATKLISKIIGQEIYVIDASRLHHIKDGVCSCGDYC